MILDNEEQRSLILEIINQVPIQAVMEDAITIINQLKSLQAAVQSAPLQCPSQLKAVDDNT